MTGGWAATNTLREARDFVPDWYDGPLPFRDEFDAALALVEAALDAAQAFYDDEPINGEEAVGVLGDALRAVRGGK